MKKYFKYHILGLIISVFFISCETTDFDLQENPNLLNPESADPEFLLNEVQFLFREIMEDMILNTDEIMRYEAMTDNYGDVVDNDVLDLEWERYYEALNISRTIENQASTDESLLFHNAISKLLMGYLTLTMVDFIGDIPYKEASKPDQFPNPNLDKGVDLYKIVLEDIDQAIIDIEASNFNVSTDIIYANDKNKWIAFANSLKLKLLIQTRLVSNELDINDIQSEINSLINSNIIDQSTEDFEISYSSIIEPEGRHPYYTRGYISGFSQYIGNYFMWMLKDSKTVEDPRIRYYLYRQSDADPFSGSPYLACQGDPDVDFCYVGEQYWGLDHGETRTGRGDNLLRTVYGIYPAGGTFDSNQFVNAPNTTNSGGAGILPLLPSFNLKFLLAESALTLGTNGDPAQLLEEAIRASMGKVLNFGNVSSDFVASNSDIDDYVNQVMENYLVASTDNEKLDIIVTEFYLANYGNSMEAYNSYRRTGYPSNIQIPIDDDNPTFPRSFPYSNEEVQTNSSISQKLNTIKVFWDVNPDGFIK